MIAIAIDGHSGSGKGELSRGLAKELNLKHLDTGAILRAMGLYFYRLNITNPTEIDVVNHYSSLNISVEFEDDKQITLLDGEDVSSEIRVEHIGQMASKVAVIEKAMRKMIDIFYGFLADSRHLFQSFYDSAYTFNSHMGTFIGNRQLNIGTIHADQVESDSFFFDVIKNFFKKITLIKK